MKLSSRLWSVPKESQICDASAKYAMSHTVLQSVCCH